MIAASLKALWKELTPFNAKLIAVSKTKPNEDLAEAYDAGNRIFGENKVQELVAKAEALPKDIEWHFIGHLQRNKVKYIAPFVSLIHAVDSVKLLKEINKQGAKHNRIIECLLQVHIAQEEAKFGFNTIELNQALSSPELNTLSHIKVIGLMGMATNTTNETQVISEFRGLQSVFKELKQTELPHNVEMKELSMGMSGDYKLALAEGSTMVRIGSSIFGLRNYPTNA
ncbi:MAG: YggS family pyridoxal phosphate-dependent enzyme [Cyclobacteriaceae bacterium]|nr:YggS family pyridoxal phosphate-dependent enzyme [Cyclobacteriaceae bacterium]